jgi:hypothetical protein
MSGDYDVRTIVSLYGADLDSWLNDRPSGTLMWWEGILEGVEIEAHFMRGVSDQIRREIYNAGARLLAAGAARGEISTWVRAYWQIRMAVEASRPGRALPGLADILTLSGAARWTLANMPASREEIIDYRREREAIFADPNEYPAQLSDLPPGTYGKPPFHIATLQHVEKILSALSWIDLSQVDEDLRREAEAWLQLLS